MKFKLIKKLDSDSFQNFLDSADYYTPETYRRHIDYLSEILQDDIIRFGRAGSIYNIPAAFDIETTSTYINGKKAAWMYVWMLGVYDSVCIGRTWEEFYTLLDYIAIKFNLSERCALPVYVHNLAYEFGYIQHRHEWESVFSLAPRKPVYARTTNGILFRCSYILSGVNLAKMAGDLHTYKIKKMLGDLDYKQIRHSGTPLTVEEIGYCINDVKIVMAYIREKIDTGEDLAHIPLTKTGYVRNYIREKCLPEDTPEAKNYHLQMLDMTLTEPIYTMLKNAFAGGFVHGDPFRVNKIWENVSSIDFTSSYPAVIASNPGFPMSRGYRVNIKNLEQLEVNLKYYWCVFDIEIKGLQATFFYDNYISESRCFKSKNVFSQNGRVVSADYIYMTVTSEDYLLIRKMYTWGEIRIHNFYRFRTGYLPKPFIEALLDLYERKTMLKNVPGRELDYLLAKELLNSFFGCCVTDICKDEQIFDGRWRTEPADVTEKLEQYNKKFNRTLYYAWGVKITAAARYNLWSGIYECKGDYIYSDTDSIKMLNYEKHKDYVDRYNKSITDKLWSMCTYYDIPFERTRPKTIKGVEKPLGVWDYEGTYKRFKTLGAKRYMYEDEAGYHLTVAGLNKKTAMQYIIDEAIRRGCDPFEVFSAGMYVPKGAAGKLTHTYIDDVYNAQGEKVKSGERAGAVVDMYGIPGTFHEYSAVHLEEADYSLTMTREFMDYIRGLAL